MNNVSTQIVVVANEAVFEINRLHRLAEERAGSSVKTAAEAVVAAWEAGRLLSAEKERVRCEYGHGAWEAWVEMNFQGSLTTAKRYLRVYKKATCVADLPKVNLRKAYHLLGIVTKSPTTSEEPRLKPVEQHLVLIQKLTAFLQRENIAGARNTARVASLRRDFAPLLEQIRQLSS